MHVPTCGKHYFFFILTSGVTGSSKTILPSAECFSKVCPAGTWQDLCSHGFQDRTDPGYLRATGKALTWTGFFCSTKSSYFRRRCGFLLWETREFAVPKLLEGSCPVPPATKFKSRVKSCTVLWGGSTVLILHCVQDREFGALQFPAKVPWTKQPLQAGNN